jgi:hypothetical protein
MEPDFYYLDAQGKRCDASLHEELLNSVEGNIASDLAGLKAARRAGIPLYVALTHFTSPELRKWLLAQLPRLRS